MRIIGLIKSVLTNTNARGISTILLVGGFSECHLAQAAIRDVFSDKTIISPEEPSLVVLKGAVLFGHMQ
jgi:molecular chaperone DnaK (HSP70)